MNPRKLVTLPVLLILAAASAACGSAGDQAASGGDDASALHRGHPGRPNPPLQPQPKANGAPGVEDVTVSVGARTRSYVRIVPADYDAARSYPLVMVFHGDGGSASDFHGSYPFENASGSDAIVVFPNGAAGDAWDISTPAAANEDFAFVEAIVQDVASTYAIDQARVFGDGSSKGGFFLNQIACRKGGIFRAITSQGGGAPYTDDANDPDMRADGNGLVHCNAETAVSMLVIYGQDDNVVGPDSGRWAGQYWGYINGCGDDTAPVAPSPCRSANACASGKPVVVCSLPNVGHGTFAEWSPSMATSWSFFASAP